NALVVFGPHLTVRTDAAGEAPMLEESVGWVIHPDFAVVRPTPRLAPVARVKLEKGITLRGRVVNGKGEGVKADLFLLGVPAGSSGDDGTFAIAHAPSQWSALRAVAGNQAAFVAHSDAAQIEVRLAPAAVISGSLRESGNRRGVAGSRVMLRNPAGPEVEGYEIAIADAKGNFAFDPLPPRSYA